jgi:Na+-driven multidrug efflux pump
MQIDPSFRKSVAIGVVVTILSLVFIQPAIHWCADSLMWLSANYSERFTKAVYNSAAMGLREKYSFEILAAAMSTAMGFGSGVLLSVLLFPIFKTKEENMGHAGAPSSTLIWRILAVVFGLSCLLSGSDMLASNFIALQLNTSFNQRLTVLAAKETDQEIKELRASWALMDNRADYEAINLKMAQLSQALNVKLPPPLWP